MSCDNRLKRRHAKHEGAVVSGIFKTESSCAACAGDVAIRQGWPGDSCALCGFRGEQPMHYAIANAYLGFAWR